MRHAATPAAAAPSSLTSTRNYFSFSRRSRPHASPGKSIAWRRRLWAVVRNENELPSESGCLLPMGGWTPTPDSGHPSLNFVQSLSSVCPHFVQHHPKYKICPDSGCQVQTLDPQIQILDAQDSIKYLGEDHESLVQQAVCIILPLGSILLNRTYGKNCALAVDIN